MLHLFSQCRIWVHLIRIRSSLRSSPRSSTPGEHKDHSRREADTWLAMAVSPEAYDRVQPEQELRPHWRNSVPPTKYGRVEPGQASAIRRFAFSKSATNAANSVKIAGC